MDIKNTPRDTFLYLLSIITLVASAISFGALVFGLIDIRFPDPLNPYASVNYGGIRMALATLIIVFPVFFWVSTFLHKDVVTNPEKRDSKLRKWLMYLTVFAAGLVVIGDLVTLIYNFLQGDLTTPFLLKILTVFFIAGSSFFYYLSEIRAHTYPRKAFQAVIVVVVAAAVVFGFYKAGSPASQRLIRFDQQKIGNLQNTQDRLVYYWQQKGSLPAALSELNDPISGFAVPSDPQTGEKYEYIRTGARAFQLCAVFNLPSQADPSIAKPVFPPEQIFYNWQHETGRSCFDRTIDPLLYPVKPR